MKVDNSSAIIFFENAKNGLSSFGNKLSAFEVAGADKIFYPADAKITGAGVVVQSDQVKEPVRYGMRLRIGSWVISLIRRGFPHLLSERIAGNT